MALQGKVRTRSKRWPALSYDAWSATCDTLHAHTQVLGKLAVELKWEDIRESADPHALALQFARSAFWYSCAVCEWDPVLAASAEGVPQLIR